MNTLARSCCAVALLALCAACGRPEETEPAPAPEPAPSARAAGGAAVELLPADGPSLYELDLPLVDQDGKPVALDTFAGHPVILTMFYASCPVACPMLISDVKNVVKKTSPDTQAELGVLLVSLDPERDTPEAMRALATTHRVNTPGWRFTRTTEESTRELAAVLGIKYKKLESGAIRHTSLISVLDSKGVVRYRATSPLPVDHSVAEAVDAVR